MEPVWIFGNQILYKSLVSLFFISIFLSSSTFGKSLFPELSKNRQKILSDYIKIQKRFTKKYCAPGIEESFWKLFRAYRGNGYYIPLTTEEKLDRVNLNRYIPEVQRKVNWIQSQIDYLNRHRKFGKYRAEIKKLQKELAELLQYKKDFYLSANESVKNKARSRSTYKMITFRSDFKKLIKKLSFLTSYRSSVDGPLDHFELRENYDEFKGTKDPKEKERMNEVYFYRKIVQDGAQNPNHSGSDTFLRAAIDTILIRFQNPKDFIQEDLRFDISWVLKGLDRHLSRGVNNQKRRMKEWKGRTQRTLDFYRSLRDNRVKVADHFETGQQIIESKSKARFALKNYVLNKQKESYEFWKDKSEIMQAIFSLETILFNEVGGYERRDTFERRDVSQVVINRVNDPKYNFIPSSEPLYDLLKWENLKGDIRTNPWLNVLFKEGEFSFTYFFIHGNLRIHCPDNTRRGRNLRRQNIRIALDMLEKPNPSFRGKRYFSRASMLGRIDMSSLWSEYNEIPERAGRVLGNSKQLRRKFDKGNYQYFYQFTDPKGRMFLVVEIDDKVYAMSSKEKTFYSYRSPHFFRYFEAHQKSSAFLKQ